MEGKLSKKSCRKQKRARHRLLRDMNIKCCDDPTQCLMICNAGLVTGLQRQTLKDVIEPLVIEKKHGYDLIMPPNKSYCFVKFDSIGDAISVYNKIHRGNVKSISQEQTKTTTTTTRLYATFTESVPELNESQFSDHHHLPNNNDLLMVPGLKLIENCITEEQERMLLDTINWSDEESSDLKHRRVKHFGYEFRYDKNNVDADKPIAPIPKDYQFLLGLLKKYHDVPYDYDQLTINHYLPGQGIPPHIDTHSAFEDSIASLSLGSDCIMDFKKERESAEQSREKKIHVLLPSRSLLIMSGEARYAWTHGICPRHNDVVETKNGITTQSRGTRVSFTFRKIHRGDCRCSFPDYCDRTERTTVIDDKIAPVIENSYVHDVYDKISNHFDETRHKRWPNVSKFLQSLNVGDVLLDVGCGNGKYLFHQEEEERIFKVGCDRSCNLTKICRSKNFEVLLSDCLHLPYKDASLDAVICIAVIHHLATHERRRQAICELARVLRPGSGRCLIYVWAREQEKDSVRTAYLRCNSNSSSSSSYSNNKKEESACTQKLTEFCDGVVALPVHENRTNFTSNDMLVPWKRKGGGNFLRFYHVFRENELSQLCSEVPEFAIVDDVYYDQGNWCVILEKRMN